MLGRRKGGTRTAAPATLLSLAIDFLSPLSFLDPSFPTSPFVTMVATLSLIGGVLTLLASNVDAVPLESRAATNVLPSYISTNLGPYSPYLAQGSYPAVPAGCTLNQVRFALSFSSLTFLADLAFLHRSTSSSVTANVSLYVQSSLPSPPSVADSPRMSRPRQPARKSKPQSPSSQRPHLSPPTSPSPKRTPSPSALTALRPTELRSCTLLVRTTSFGTRLFTREGSTLVPTTRSVSSTRLASTSDSLSFCISPSSPFVGLFPHLLDVDTVFFTAGPKVSTYESACSTLLLLLSSTAQAECVFPLPRLFPSLHSLPISLSH